MLIFKSFFTLLFIINWFVVFPQQNGVVEYEYIYNPSIGKNPEGEMQVEASDELKQAAEYAKMHKYFLKFNPSESYYYIQEVTRPEFVENSFAFKISKSMMSRGIYYQNLKKRFVLNERESMHTLYLVKDTIKNDWTIQYEKRMMGGFKCYKATKKCKCGKDIVAWFTPEIPLPFGPAGYGGTPGLILEITFYKHTLRMKSIKLQKDYLEIKPPSKGKLISRSELEDLQWQKRLELMQKARRK